MLQTKLLASVLFILVVLKPATSQEVEDESEFNYSENSERGPARWGACSNGTMQSPIDISNQRVDIGKLKRSYKPANATLRNSMALHQCHWQWHSPSEHTINGRQEV
ncbi:hypothetical protein V6N13_139255 [Hibiscus sabdariffa]